MTLSSRVGAWRGLVGLAFLLAAGLFRLEAAGRPAASKPASEYFPIKLGEKTVRMQVVVTESELQKGLMFRRSLKDDEGMLFVFGRPQEMSFYMRNTSIPLHIGYFDKGGILREMYPLYPYDENSVRSRGDQLQFALEVNQGWFAANGIKPGAALDLKAVLAAVEARGFSRVEFGY